MFRTKIFEKTSTKCCQNVQKSRMEKVKSSEKTCIQVKRLTKGVVDSKINSRGTKKNENFFENRTYRTSHMPYKWFGRQVHWLY